MPIKKTGKRHETFLAVWVTRKIVPSRRAADTSYSELGSSFSEDLANHTGGHLLVGHGGDVRCELTRFLAVHGSLT
jgi:hypothetical protein